MFKQDKEYDVPMRMITVHHDSSWKCPWCGDMVDVDVAHEDRGNQSRNKIRRVVQ